MANVGFKLEPIPDEAIFGMCIQVGVLKGAQTYVECLNLLFGDKRKQWLDPHDVSPTRLELLLQFVAVDGPEQLLKNHSAWPYFVAFQNTSLSDVLRLGIEGFNPLVALGLAGTQAIEDTKVAKYCSACATEQQKKYKRTTWLRSHQLPGVKVCHRHGLALSESNLYLAKVARMKQEIEFPVASREASPNLGYEVASPDVWNIEQPYRLWAQISRDVLFSDELFSDKEKVLNLCRNELRRRGLLTSSKYDWQGIENVFRQRYGDLFAENMNIDFCFSTYSNWLKLFFLEREYFRQPARHLLVIGALFDFLPNEQMMTSNDAVSGPPLVRTDRVARIAVKLRDRNRSDMRAQVEKLLGEDPSLTRSGLKVALGRWNYQWLSQNDGEWLDKHIRKRMQPKRFEIADWQARDEKLINIVSGLSAVQRSRVIRHGGAVNVSELSRIAKMPMYAVSVLVEKSKMWSGLKGLKIAF